jgi:phosphatidate cytidylyltransferase
MFYLRLISFIILTSIVGYSLLSEHWSAIFIFGAFAVSAAFLVILETFNMLEKINYNGFKYYTATVAAICILLMLVYPPGLLPVLVCYLLSLWLSVLFVQQRQQHIGKVIVSMGVLCLVALPLSFMVGIYQLLSPLALLYMILVTKSGDTGAYIVGTLSNIILKGNNHKIVPNISPKKSWEGTVGGMIFSIAVSLLPVFIVFEEFPLTIPHAVIIGIVLFWGGFCGDLTESVLKRTCNVKDSGNLIPGMGGVFDFLDSLILNAPLFFVYVYIKFIYNI